MSKTKTDQFQIHRYRFLILWASSNAFAWGVVYAVVPTLANSFGALVFGAMGALFGALNGGCRHLLLERMLRLDVPYWWLPTTVAMAIGWQVASEFFVFSLIGASTLIFAIPSILQWVILRRLIRSSSLWVLATIVSSILVWQILWGPWILSYSYPIVIIIVASAIQGFVLGFIMLWLIERLSRDSNIRKEKIEYDEDGHVVHASE